MTPLVAFMLTQIQPFQPYVDEQCAYAFACQNKTIWELVYQGQVISEPYHDMTLEECEELRSQIDPQTAPFTEVTCRPRLVEREGA
jgi:hypothetical protein